MKDFIVLFIYIVYTYFKKYIQNFEYFNFVTTSLATIV